MRPVTIFLFVVFCSLSGCGRDSGSGFFEGKDPVEIFLQTSPEIQPVDILWVIDGSLSMEDDLIELREIILKPLSGISLILDWELDFNMAITSMNIYEHKGKNLDSEGTLNAEKALENEEAFIDSFKRENQGSLRTRGWS